ncbi:hypothetical protein [Sediminibacter sp. Hel_I_10]|uniref:hypothetical protein n=1 Tax=Sediminibacter sp. Hel_I_10 TaxID=1392490 RepID=UPI0012DE733D|nr:hypothetical protein [Sediminibacter sp. Hel_I_10]
MKFISNIMGFLVLLFCLLVYKVSFFRNWIFATPKELTPSHWVNDLDEHLQKFMFFIKNDDVSGFQDFVSGWNDWNLQRLSQYYGLKFSFDYDLYAFIRNHASESFRMQGIKNYRTSWYNKIWFNSL